MQSRELTIGRTFGVTFDHGEDFFDALSGFCTDNGVRQAFIPSFIAGFAEAEVVGTCERLANPKAPVWSTVYLENAEVLGSGTIAYDEEAGKIRPHLHIALGLKQRAATGYTSHLLRGRVQFLVEMLLVEVAAPQMRRPRNPGLYDVPLLTFD